ncbi:MAG: hypothetical protein ACRD2J_02180 [Thermoanaerobaculia bacterium]
MKIAMRAVLVAAIAVVLAWAVHGYAWERLRCNVVEQEVETRTRAAFADPNPLQRASQARRNLRAIEPCRDACGANVNCAMIRAANLRILGELRAAATEYESALAYDRRPEIYLNLGIVRLQMGDRAGAESAIVSAALFDPTITARIPDSELRVRVERRMEAIFESWRTSDRRNR